LKKLAIALILSTTVGLFAQDVKAPTVSDMQKLKVQNLALRLDNAQLRAQVAQADYEKTRIELTTMIQSLQVEGYDLDLQTLTYTKKTSPPITK